MTSVLREAAAVLEVGEQGAPRVLRWGARTFRVTDAPTPLQDALDALTTHPLPVHGWRFQGTEVADRETLVFDVLACPDGWRVLHVYR